MPWTPGSRDWRGLFVVGTDGIINANHAIIRYAETGVFTANDSALINLSNVQIHYCGTAVQFWAAVLPML